MASALTPVFYSRLTANAMWFAGAGLAMIFVGFLNVVLSRGAVGDTLSRVLVYVANLLTLAFGSVTVHLDGEPQVVFGMMLIATISGAIDGGLLALKNREGMMTAIPFGVFLGFAFLVTIFFEPKLTGWYLTMLVP